MPFLPSLAINPPPPQHTPTLLPLASTKTLLKPAALAMAPGGKLLLTNHVSSVDLDEWVDSCVRCCTKAGRPPVDVEVINVDVDFPPRPPTEAGGVCGPILKMVVLTMP